MVSTKSWCICEKLKVLSMYDLLVGPGVKGLKQNLDYYGIKKTWVTE